MSESTSSDSPSSPPSMPKSLVDRYVGDEHLAHHPTWHLEESSWKTKHVLRMIGRNNLAPISIADVGCGAGEVLRLLQQQSDPKCEFWGFDISPQALNMTRERENDRLHFQLGGLPSGEAFYDLLIALDVVEHVEDCFGFLRAMKPKSLFKIFELPLDLSVQTIARPRNLIDQRREHGHIHYFTKELALQLLNDSGFEILDHFYTSPALELRSRSPKNLMLRPARKLLGAINEDISVRCLGGYRIMILAK
jgi:SAM-dependent methyltransferase